VENLLFNLRELDTSVTRRKLNLKVSIALHAAGHQVLAPRLVALASQALALHAVGHQALMNARKSNFALERNTLLSTTVPLELQHFQ